MSAAPSRATCERVVGLAHALVGGDRQLPVVQPLPQLDELGDRRARLLEVLEVERGEGVRGALRLVHVPAAVGVDPDAALRPEERTRRAHAGHVIRRASVRRSATFTFTVRTAREPREHPLDLDPARPRAASR